MRLVSVVTALAALAGFSPLAGCTDSPRPDAQESSQSTSPSPTVQPESPSPSEDSTPDPPSEDSTPDPRRPANLPGKAVTFRAVDDTRLEGRLIGRGEVGVVLSHMGRPGDDQRDWFPLARTLARNGYTVLTYNRRGVCPRKGFGCSTGSDDLSLAWKDVAGAYHYLQQRGTQRVVLGGASIGAMSSLYAATRRDIQPIAVVWTAGVLGGSGYYFRRSTPCKVGVPAFYASGNQDSYQAADDARQLHQWSVQAGIPTTLKIVRSTGHGTELLEHSASRHALVTAIVEFLDQQDVDATRAPAC